MEDKATKGYVYILTNPSFKEDWIKIGKSSRPVNVRAKELDNTAVPLPFEIYATLSSSRYSEVEKLVHRSIDRLTSLRIRSEREFFNILPSTALDILLDIALVIEDAEVELYDNNKVVRCIYPQSKEPKHSHDDEGEGKKKPAPSFTFSSRGIAVGSSLIFIPTGVEVLVHSDKQIIYKGEVYSMSGFTKIFMPEDRKIPSGAYQGPAYFTYNGIRLTNIEEVK